MLPSNDLMMTDDFPHIRIHGSILIKNRPWPLIALVA